MGNEQSLIDDDVAPVKLDERSLPGVAKLIKDGKAKKILVMTGAGLSTAAGIPDFRSPGTGLYANLARLNLPTAESVFDIAYFRSNPNPFYVLAKELYPGNYKPTLSHVFIALLAKKGLLRLLFTQNIDCLEREAGVPGDLIVEAHGSFATQRCIECKKEFPDGPMKQHVLSGEVPHCVDTDTCNGLVKPDIVFFGESLPAAFFHNLHALDEADLVLVMGTSLTVHPFASLPERVGEDCPRVLFNMERVGSLGTRPDDVLALGDCDANVCTLAGELGWLEELHALWEETVGEAEAKKQMKGIQDRKEKMLGDMEELTNRIGAGLNLDDADESNGSERSGEGGGSGSAATDSREGRVGGSLEEGKDRGDNSSGSVGDHPDETTTPVSRTRDTTDAAQVAEPPQVHSQDLKASAGGASDNASEVEAEAKEAPGSASAFDTEVKKDVQPKEESASESDAANEGPSKEPQESSNKSVL